MSHNFIKIKVKTSWTSSKSFDFKITQTIPSQSKFFKKEPIKVQTRMNWPGLA